MFRWTILVLCVLLALVSGISLYDFEERQWLPEPSRHHVYHFNNVKRRSPQYEMPAEPEMFPNGRDLRDFSHRGGPPNHRGPPDRRGPPDNRGPPDHRGPPNHRGPPDHRGPPGQRGPPDYRGPPNNRGPPDYMRPVDNRPPPNSRDPGDYRRPSLDGSSSESGIPQDHRGDINENQMNIKNQKEKNYQNNIGVRYSDFKETSEKTESPVKSESHWGVPLVNIDSLITKQPLQNTIPIFQAVAVTPESK